MAFKKFLKRLTEKIQKDTLINATISQARQRSNKLKRIRLRPIMLQEQLHIQFEYQYDETMNHENIPVTEIASELEKLLNDFRQVHAQFAKELVHIQISKRYKVRWQEKHSEKKQPINLTHNRKKEYLLSENKPYPFLIRLGVQTEEGKVRSRYYDKFRQINRFVELIDDTLDYLPQNRPIRILDFGSGKSYLTFALYHYLRNEKGLDIHITGLDLKEEVIHTCETIARDLDFDQLNFEVGDINDYQEETKIDMVVTLHACDVATDMALAQAVQWNAKVILSVPCCQHELRNQIHSVELELMLKHGLIKERFSALATDSIRAELLSLVGYDTQLVEFISMEHTPKNTLIRAYYTGRKPTKKEIDEYESFRNMLNVNPFLEKELSKEIEGLSD